MSFWFIHLQSQILLFCEFGIWFLNHMKNMLSFAGEWLHLMSSGFIYLSLQILKRYLSSRILQNSATIIYFRQKSQQLKPLASKSFLSEKLKNSDRRNQMSLEFGLFFLKFFWNCFGILLEFTRKAHRSRTFQEFFSQKHLASPNI